MSKKTKASQKPGVKLQDLIEEALKSIEREPQKAQRTEEPQVNVYELQEEEEDLETFLKKLEEVTAQRPYDQLKKGAAEPAPKKATEPAKAASAPEAAAPQKVAKPEQPKAPAQTQQAKPKVKPTKHAKKPAAPKVDHEKIALLNELSEAKRQIKDLHNQLEMQTLKHENILKQKEMQIQEFVEKIKQMHVKFSNYKRRMEREKEEFKKFSLEEFIIQLLPVLDDLELALKHAREGSDVESIIKGLEMVVRKFYGLLESFGVKPIEARNQPFNPEVHEAMAQVESDEHDSITVIDEMQKGFTMHGRLLRPSKVIVSKNKKRG